MLNLIAQVRKNNSSSLLASDSRIVIHHLLGDCPIEQTSIIIGVSTAQRSDAFEICQNLLEEVKKRVQIWKLEHYGDGQVPCWKENFSPSQISPDL